MFHLDVAYVAVAISYVASIFLQMFHLFHMYDAEFLHVAILTDIGSGHTQGGPRMRAGSEAGVDGPHLHA
jgi:hypothetical protein